MCEDDCDIEEDTEGYLTVRRQAYVKFDLQECKAMVNIYADVQRANAVGRHKQADVHMEGYVAAFGGVLNTSLPLVATQHVFKFPSIELPLAANQQRAVAK